MTDDERHVLERFVAGLEVGADELAGAITARAVDRTVIEESLIAGLTSEEAVVRVRAARRIARMPDVEPQVVARLRAVAEADADPRARRAAAAAMEAHADAPESPPLPRSRPRVLATLTWRGLAARRGGPDHPLFGPEIHAGAGDAGARLIVVGDEARLEVTGLPPAFAGTRPVLLAGEDELARAAAPVTEDGAVTLLLPAAPAPELARRIDGAELAALDE